MALLALYLTTVVTIFYFLQFIKVYRNRTSKGSYSKKVLKIIELTLQFLSKNLEQFHITNKFVSAYTAELDFYILCIYLYKAFSSLPDASQLVSLRFFNNNNCSLFFLLCGEMITTASSGERAVAPAVSHGQQATAPANVRWANKFAQVSFSNGALGTASATVVLRTSPTARRGFQSYIYASTI